MPHPEDAADRWSIGRLIRWTADFLRKKGADNPRLDAEVLLAHVLGSARVQLYTHFDEEVGDEPRSRYRELVKCRSEGTPVAYLIGRKEFYALTFKVTPAVLIPRPETEYLVLEFLTKFKTVENPVALDLGTGSGCVSLACLSRHKTARFLGTDVSPEALAVAEENAQALNFADRFSTHRAELFENLELGTHFDAIVTNPPYLRTDEIAGLDRDVRDYEPTLALDGGEDGLRVIEPILRGAETFLKPGGALFLEFGYQQADAIKRLVGERTGLKLVSIVKDQADHPRILHAVRPS